MAIGVVWGDIWDTSVWDTSVWMQSTSYPALPIDNNSSRASINLGVTDITASGIVKQRDFSAVDLFEFEVIHTLLTQTEAESIYTNWQSNKITAQTFTWVDSNSYTVRYKEPPVLQHMTGPYWSVACKLIGTAV